jgi:hypothetical protein
MARQGVFNNKESEIKMKKIKYITIRKYTGDLFLSFGWICVLVFVIALIDLILSYNSFCKMDLIGSVLLVYTSFIASLWGIFDKNNWDDVEYEVKERDEE